MQSHVSMILLNPFVETATSTARNNQVCLDTSAALLRGSTFNQFLPLCALFGPKRRIVSANTSAFNTGKSNRSRSTLEKSKQNSFQFFHKVIKFIVSTYNRAASS